MALRKGRGRKSFCPREHDDVKEEEEEEEVQTDEKHFFLPKEGDP